jgi:hypothetical protein
MAVGLHVADHGLDGGATSQFAFDDAEHAALLSGDEDAVWVGGVMAAVSLVDIGARDVAAGEPFGGVDDGAERVARRKDCPAAPWRAGRTDRTQIGLPQPHAVRVGQAIEPLDRRVQQLGAGQVLGPQRASRWTPRCNPRPSRSRPTADVADDTAEPAAQDAQLAMMALELLGVGIAARHHGGALGTK